jgi:DNA helicase II / ATP-dependent DNA helicase PcrA
MGTAIEVQDCDPIFSNLNSEQVDAVNSELTRHILVLAGAGCGKTTVLTRRIAFLIRSEIAASAILALTFTRKAADEMAARAGKSDLIPPCSPIPLITTFHGFALKVLSEKIDTISNFERIGYSGNIRLASETERLSMLSSISKPEDRRSFGLDLLKLDALLAKYEVYPEYRPDDENCLNAYLKEVARQLNTKKLACGMWSFSDLLAGCLQLFNQYPQIASLYTQRFRAILVDEFQDTNPIQIRLLKRLLSDTTTVFAVGDDDQAIYGFRGADIGPTIEFTKYFEGARIVKLQTNYRSVPAILDFANKIFIDKSANYKKILISGKYPDHMGRWPSWHRFETQSTMVRWVAQKAFNLRKEHKIPYSSMALLFRINQTLEFVSVLINAEVPDISDITLLTIHKSKGLEFPVVFICDLEECVFPSYRIPEKRAIHTFKDFVVELFRKRKPIQCDWDEERRLFYVAATRAEKHLFLLSVRNKKVYGRLRKFEHSRFCRYV